MYDYGKKSEKVFKKQGSEIENQQEVVLVEIGSYNSEDDNRLNIRAHPSIAKCSALMRETLGSLMKSHNF